MIQRFICRVMVLSVLLWQLVFPLIPAFALIHPLATVGDKSTAGIQDVDITISLDWDPAAVTGTEADPRGFTKAEFDAVIDNYAKSLFAMTNGRHRIRNVYVFAKSAFWDMTDIRYISKEVGRANANISAWKGQTGQITMYVYDSVDADGKWIVDDAPGPTLAHECGHYIYGIYDEYVEPKEIGGMTRDELKKLNKLWKPAADDDGTQASIMNNSKTYPNWFSHDGGYDTAARKNSAQYRMFEKSIWGTLVSDPETDHANARGDNRMGFDAFKDITVTKVADLKPTQTGIMAGYKDAPTKIVWMTNTTYTILVADNSVSTADWKQALKSVEAAIGAASPGNWVSVMVGNTVKIDRAERKVTNKETLIKEVSGLTQGTAATVEKALEAAIAQAKKYRTDTGNEVTCTINLVTSGIPIVPETLYKSFYDAKSMLSVASIGNAQSVKPPEGMMTITDMAARLGGKANIATRAQKRETQMVRNINLLEGDNTADIAAEFFPEPLAAGGFRTMTFTAGPKETTVVVSFFADEDEWDRVTPSLIDPRGNTIAEGRLPAGVTLEKDSGTGVWVFTIDKAQYAAGTPGSWIARMAALSGTAEPLAMVVSAESGLNLRVTMKEHPFYGYVARASLIANRPILNARVTASLYDGGGNILESLTLKDDGLNGDLRAGDGIYSSRILTAPADQEYTIVAWADDNNGLAVESDRELIFVKTNATVNETATGAFQRTAEETFTMGSSASSGSGRCFLAEAAFGSYLDPHVGVLRAFRDHWLLPYETGRMIVQFYYVHSPGWAAFLRQHEAARLIARGALTPVVYSIQYPFIPAGMVLMCIGFSTRKRWMYALQKK